MQRDERPGFHLTPRRNWMNDPNGLVFRNGRLHAFYQHNPDAPAWGRMHWGHATSRDLVTWRHLPTAISPGDVGPDSFGCWSGCIVDTGATATMFYTAVVLRRGQRRTSIRRATSTDGLRTWTKDPRPCVAGPPAGISPDAFRDPAVYRDERGWFMLVGAGTIAGDGTSAGAGMTTGAGPTAGDGAVLIYRSSDLRSWRHAGAFLATKDLARVGGADGPCWECPQLVRLDGAAVLIVSVVDRTPGVRPSHVEAFVGRVEGDRFVVDHAEQLGMGPDFYAPVAIVTPDGRHLVFGWIPEDPPPDGAGRTWAGSLTFPRIVSLGGDGRLSLGLASEVAALRGTPRRLRPSRLVDGAPARRFRFEGRHFELAVTLREERPGSGPEDPSSIVIELVDEAAPEPEVRLVYHPPSRLLTIARSGIVSVAGRSSQNATILPGELGQDLDLRLIVDGSIMEIEADGRTMATFRLPLAMGDRLAITVAASGGSARLRRAKAWTLRAPRTSDA
ncbi:MAG TPA: glycoside hydrolase family 32 protein [Candidatus Limnocylindrales bacterium]